jgi:hypothetical protein
MDNYIGCKHPCSLTRGEVKSEGYKRGRGKGKGGCLEEKCVGIEFGRWELAVLGVNMLELLTSAIPKRAKLQLPLHYKDRYTAIFSSVLWLCCKSLVLEIQMKDIYSLYFC